MRYKVNLYTMGIDSHGKEYDVGTFCNGYMESDSLQDLKEKVKADTKLTKGWSNVVHVVCVDYIDTSLEDDFCGSNIVDFEKYYI